MTTSSDPKSSTSRLKPFSKVRRRLIFEGSPEKSSKNPTIEIPSEKISTCGCETPPSKRILNHIEDCWEELLAVKRRVSRSSAAIEAERARKIRILMSLR
ncbi:hypothetical protein L6164_023687 [Bauhinia variegata]|uniref:Uncharacterized protein n=1 Tax=Bauhinia variegata TaxID=167791 RepID=A0ACB9ML06_BAUVA|nr:hypothetical protein L6164_023687 [Bauhinia variegata]